jgi:hypothetical protein
MSKLKAVAAVGLMATVLGMGNGLLPMSQPALGAALPKAAGQARPEEKGRTEPPGALLAARLIANKDTYVLDLVGKTPEELRKLVEGRTYVPAPAVDLELELRNRGDKDLTVLVGGTNPDVPLLLKLEGPGAVNVVLPALNSKMKSTPPMRVMLAPGKTYTIPIKDLRTKNVGRVGSASYWCRAGDYKLIATYKTAVSPVPEGVKDDGSGFGRVTVITAPLMIKVIEAEK